MWSVNPLQPWWMAESDNPWYHGPGGTRQLNGKRQYSKEEAEDSAWKEESAGIGILKIGQTVPEL